MSFIPVKPQPPGPVPHGAHCAGGMPGWIPCESCARAEAALCIAFWQTMGGVPPIVRHHVKTRMAGYTRKPAQLSPIASVDWA